MSETPAQRPAAKFPLKAALLAVLAVGVAGVLYVVFSAASNTQTQTSYARFATGALQRLEVIPEPPAQPTAVFVDAAGLKTTLADFRGRVILVNLWATWCPPCVKEMPTLATLQNAFPADAFKVVAISVDRAAEDKLAQAELAKLTGGVLAFYHDPNYAVVYPMKARGFPTSVLYDAQGREIARLAGDADWGSAEAKALIAAAIAESSGVRPAAARPSAPAPAPG